jgi:hypothetical protein
MHAHGIPQAVDGKYCQSVAPEKENFVFHPECLDLLQRDVFLDKGPARSPGSKAILDPMTHSAGQDYRADIDGLRAVAVVSGLLFHAFSGMVSGGFVGVDMFFVISGFLITRILFSQSLAGRFAPKRDCNVKSLLSLICQKRRSIFFIIRARPIGHFGRIGESRKVLG